MEITEVRIKLMENQHERLQAFCSITLEGCFVIRDLKIIQGSKGSFVAMPSRKLTSRCPACRHKNHLRSQFCNHCGERLPDETAEDDGRSKLYADIAHPINSECRDMIQEAVLTAYEQELIEATKPNYVCRYDDYGEDDLSDDSGTAPQPIHFQANGKHWRIDSAEKNQAESGLHTTPKHASEPRRVPQEALTNDQNDMEFGAGIIE